MTATIHQFYEWAYQARISIANPSSTEGFQGSISLAWREGMNPDFSDVRFFSPRGEQLPYWIETYTASTSATVWIALPASDTFIWMLFGNPGAEDASDGDSVFLIFDDFDGASIDTNKWTVEKKGSASAVVQHDGSGNLQLAGKANVISSGNVVSKATFEKGIYIEYREKVDHGHYHDTTFGSDTTLEDLSGGTSDWWHTSLGNGYILFCQDSDTTGTEGNWFHGIRKRGTGSYTNIAYIDTVAPHPSLNTYYVMQVRWDASDNIVWKRDATTLKAVSDSTYAAGTMHLHFHQGEYTSGDGGNRYIDWVRVRYYAATEPTLSIGPVPEPNPYLPEGPTWLSLPLLRHATIWFAGVGSVQVIGDERAGVVGAGSISIETTVRSPIPIAGAAGMQTGLRLVPAPATPTGTGGIASGPACLTTPLDIEAGEGSAYVAPTPVQFDVWQYRFESLDISRSAQDALWRCDGRIDGLQAPLAYKSFAVKVPDHNGVLRTIFFGFVPGRDYVQAVAADKSTIQGFDAGFYLTRQYLPDGDLFYPADYFWTPMSLIKYWLGEETIQAGSPSYWERVSGIMPYRIHNPSTYGHPYTPKDWNFQPKATKVQAIQEVCEYSGMVFLVKWHAINGAMTPCAYLVHQDDIDHPYHGLDLPPMVTFTAPDPGIKNGVRVTLQSDEKYNRIEVRSASPSGAWFHAVRETPALQAGEELPIEYLEERSDLPIDADHGGWCSARADELYAYYTAYSYTYTLTLIDRTDLELYQRCQFYGFDAIPDGDVMRIVSIRYRVLPTHTEVGITVTPNSRLSDLRRLQRSQTADSVSEVQTISQSQIDRLAAGEVGTVVGIDGAEAIVELERRADSSVRGRIV